MSHEETRIHADEIIDGIAYRKCPKCEKLKPLDDFGIRRMKTSGKGGGPLLTNQSWCRSCR